MSLYDFVKLASACLDSSRTVCWYDNNSQDKALVSAREKTLSLRLQPVCKMFDWGVSVFHRKI